MHQAIVTISNRSLLYSSNSSHMVTPETVIRPKNANARPLFVPKTWIDIKKCYTVKWAGEVYGQYQVQG